MNGENKNFESKYFLVSEENNYINTTGKISFNKETLRPASTKMNKTDIRKLRGYEDEENQGARASSNSYFHGDNMYDLITTLADIPTTEGPKNLEPEEDLKPSLPRYVSWESQIDVITNPPQGNRNTLSDKTVQDINYTEEPSDESSLEEKHHEGFVKNETINNNPNQPTRGEDINKPGARYSTINGDNYFALDSGIMEAPLRKPTIRESGMNYELDNPSRFSRSSNKPKEEDEAMKKVFNPSSQKNRISKKIDPEWDKMKNDLINAEMNFIVVYTTIFQNPFYRIFKSNIKSAKAFEEELGYFEFMLNCHKEILEEFKYCTSPKKFCQIILSHKGQIEQHIKDEWKTLNYYSALKDELLRLNFYDQTSLIIKCYRDITQRILQLYGHELQHKQAFDLIFKVYKQNLAIKEGLKLIKGHNILLREVGMVKCQTTINLLKPSGFILVKKYNSCVFITETYIIFTVFNKNRTFDFRKALLINQIVLEFHDSKQQIHISYGPQMKDRLVIATSEYKTYDDIKKSLDKKQVFEDDFY